MRVMMGTAFAVAGLAVGALSLSACGDKKQERAQADANASGFVPPSVTSRLDFGALTERRFRRLDRDGDDRISAAEMPKRNPGQLMALDRNKDGAVSAIEFSEGMLGRFDKMDLNHDGTVTSEEREASRGR